jgi:hypothetical protein
MFVPYLNYSYLGKVVQQPQQNKARAERALCHSTTKSLPFRPLRSGGNQPLHYSTDVGIY